MNILLKIWHIKTNTLKEGHITVNLANFFNKIRPRIWVINKWAQMEQNIISIFFFLVKAHKHIPTNKQKVSSYNFHI